MGQPVVHFEISGPDAKKLQKFYASQFGWSIDAKNPMAYGVVRTGAKGKSAGINGGIFATPPGAPAMPVVIYVAVPSIDKTLKKIAKAGGKTTHPRTVIPGMVTFAQFTDPAGNVIGLVEERMPPARQPAKAPKKAPRPKQAKRRKK
jgi:predicted enzyme related to lactoylglutathione lyase